MPSVQFIGKDVVTKMYEDRDVKAWSIWQAKQFITKGVSYESLEAFLSMIEETSGAVVYTLKVYEDIDDAKMIKEKTPSDGSFNFKLNETGDTGLDKYEASNRKNKLFQRLELIENKLGKIESGEDCEPETLGDILGNPERTQQYLQTFSQALGLVKQLFGGEMPAPSVSAIGSAMSPANSSRVNKDYTGNDQERLIAAVNTLSEYDTDIIFHLEKLAQIAKTDTVTFKMLLTMLNNK